MNRRDFLKLAALGSLAVLTTQFGRRLSAIFPGATSSGDFAVRMGKMLFKETPDGRILASADGSSWRGMADFGRNARVLNLYTSGGRLFAEIGIPGGTFELASVDGVRWHTVG